MILAIDPSSSATGLAMFADDGRNVGSEVIRPDNARADAVERVFEMVCYLAQAITEAQATETVRIAIIEEPPAFKKFGSIGPQHAAYGAMYIACRAAGIARVIPVHPATWTKNRSKENRQWRTRDQLGLKPGQDSGGDAIDALMLGQYWIARNRNVLIAKSA